MAQKKSLDSHHFLFNAGIESHLPVNKFKNIYFYGIGISPLVEYKVLKSLSLIFNPAYIIYFYNLPAVGVSGSTGFITITGGAKLYFYKNFYLIAQVGLGIKTSKYGKESSFAYSGGVGFSIYKKFDIQLKYVKVKTSTLGANSIGLRLAYIFRK